MTKRLIFAALLLAVAVGLYFVTRPTSRNPPTSAVSEPGVLPLHESVANSGTPSDSREQAATPSQAKVGPASSDFERSEAPTPQPKMVERSTDTAARSPASPRVEEITGPDEELENVQFMVRGYRDVLGENPFGNNAEIVRALMGENARQVKMPLPVGSHLNENGELVDRWGTPYFFHQMSATQMEIRSAGLDQQMWTSDDLVTR